MKTINFLALTTLASATLASSAHAHIDVLLGDAPGRAGDQKAFPCDGPRGEVLTYAPGATVEMNVTEGIPHPGYFRIAFDVDGEDFVEPRSIKPIEKNRGCPFNDKDQCGEPDFCNNETVLLDNLAPHPGNLLGFGVMYNWKFKLPDVECDNCTLQIIQVMEDTVHGAYCPYDMDVCKDEQNPTQDIYHRCFDIKLKAGAKNGSGGSSDAVSLPADKKYVECSKPAPGTGSDAGALSPPDAGKAPVQSKDAAVNDDTDGTTGEISQKDAGVKKDAGSADRDEEPGAAVDDSSCALASSSSSSTEGAAWTLLAFGLLLARRRRSR
jgi:MYXO-CTERM domain-containing protein